MRQFTNLSLKLDTVEYIHKQGYICCNIMPKEILISLNKQNQNLFITDFKQARRIRTGGKSIDTLTRTANKAILNKFSSLNMHLGMRNTDILRGKDNFNSYLQLRRRKMTSNHWLIFWCIFSKVMKLQPFISLKI